MHMYMLVLSIPVCLCKRTSECKVISICINVSMYSMYICIYVTDVSSKHACMQICVYVCRGAG